MIIKKNGSVTIYVMFFFTALVILIFAFINSSKNFAVDAGNKALSNLWANSIKGEYDINLKSQYNIFGFYGFPKDVEKKIDMYAAYSYRGKDYINYQGCSCDLYNYSLGNVDVTKRQIIDVGKLISLKKIIAKSEVITNNDRPNREITNEKILNELPSKDSPDSISISSLVEGVSTISSFDDLIYKAGDKYLIGAYINHYFNNMISCNNQNETYLKNEIEYILCGEKSDVENANSIKLKFIGFREILNFTYALKDSKMNAAALIAAQAITPGPAAVITHKGLLMAWALAESYNDYKLIINGKKVPLFKDEMSWAVDLESIINNNSTEYIDTDNQHGETYDDYLTYFMYLTDDNVKILRIMDLIQINMKYIYSGEFQIRDYNAGVDLTTKINGVGYNVKTEY